MIQICDATDTVLVINHQRRWDNRFLALKEFIDDGNIGKLQSIQISFGGGRLCRSGSHIFDLALMFADSKVKEGWGHLSNPGDFDPGGLGVFKTINNIRIFIDGAVGMNHLFHANFIGEMGIIRLLDGGLQMESWLLDQNSDFGLMNQHHLPLNSPAQSPMLAAVDDLIQSIENGENPNSSGRDGRATFEMISAIHQSDKNDRKMIEFPVQERDLIVRSS